VRWSYFAAPGGCEKPRHPDNRRSGRGHGAFGYSLIEFEIFARLNIPVIAVVGNDACWSQIAHEQMKLLGDDIGTRLRHTDYHLAAQAVLINALLGASSFRDGSISM